MLHVQQAIFDNQVNVILELNFCIQTKFESGSVSNGEGI